MIHALAVEGCDPYERQHLEKVIEQLGHDMRAAVDEDYKRASWGLRPEDIEAQKGLMGDMTGQR